MAAHTRAARLQRNALQGQAKVGRAHTVQAVCERLLLALFIAVVVGQAQAQRPRGQLQDMAVEDVVVGDKGHGVTAGAGNRLETFSVEVIGVQWDGGAGFPLVIVRAGGPFITAAGGVAAGMSGSPVYIATETGDALLGAIGYVFPRADHDLALVTPIAVMRMALSDQAGASRHLPSTAFVPGIGVAVPVATPVLMTGVSARAAEFLGPLFKDASVEAFPVQSGGVDKAPAAQDAPIVPGSPIAVALAWGDVNMQAVGTVTEVEDGALLAFGHPFLGLGNVALPITPAHVTTVVPSSDVPFKLANVGTDILGTIQQDRPGAIAGRLGVNPPSVRVDVSLLGMGTSASYSFETPADDRLYPSIVGTGVLSLIDRYLEATSGGYAEVAWEIQLASGERVNVLEQTNDASDIAYRTALLALSPLAILADNQFQESDVAQVSLAIRLDDRQRVATLEEAVAEQEVVKAGENAIIHLRLQPYRQRAIVRNVSVPIPSDLEGEVTLYIRGGDVPRDTGDAHVDDKEVDRPRSYGELLDALRQQVQASELVVEVVTEDGEVLRLSRTPVAFVVDGNERLTLTIEAAGDEAPSDTPEDEAGEAGSGD